jgi:hypothetical protein
LGAALLGEGGSDELGDAPLLTNVVDGCGVCPRGAGDLSRETVLERLRCIPVGGLLCFGVTEGEDFVGSVVVFDGDGDDVVVMLGGGGAGNVLCITRCWDHNRTLIIKTVSQSWIIEDFFSEYN